MCPTQPKPPSRSHTQTNKNKPPHQSIQIQSSLPTLSLLPSFIHPSKNYNENSKSLGNRVSGVFCIPHKHARVILNQQFQDFNSTLSLPSFSFLSLQKTHMPLLTKTIT